MIFIIIWLYTWGAFLTAVAMIMTDGNVKDWEIIFGCLTWPLLVPIVSVQLVRRMARERGDE